MVPSRGRIARLRRIRAKRMARLDFERLVVQAVDGIPEPFHARMENVAVVIEVTACFEEPSRKR